MTNREVIEQIPDWYNASGRGENRKNYETFFNIEKSHKINLLVTMYVIAINHFKIEIINAIEQYIQSIGIKEEFEETYKRLYNEHLAKGIEKIGLKELNEKIDQISGLIDEADIDGKMTLPTEFGDVQIDAIQLLNNIEAETLIVFATFSTLKINHNEQEIRKIINRLQELESKFDNRVTFSQLFFGDKDEAWSQISNIPNFLEKCKERSKKGKFEKTRSEQKIPTMEIYVKQSDNANIEAMEALLQESEKIQEDMIDSLEEVKNQQNIEIKWIEQYFAKFEPDIYREIYEQYKGYYNPILNNELQGQLEFSLVPWMTDTIDGEKDEELKWQKDFLNDIFQRLDVIEAIYDGMILDNISTDKKRDIKEKINELDPKEDRVLITSILLFYLNKLTKLNRATMYYKVLGDFSYDKEMEKVIDEGEAPFLDNVQEYIAKKQEAERKGNLLVNTLRFFHGEDLELYINGEITRDRYTNYSKRVKDSKTVLKGNDVINHVRMGSFMELIEMWAQKYRETKDIPLRLNAAMQDFSIAFDEQVKWLTEQGCSYEEIIESFLYSCKTLDIIDKLYATKVILIEQLIQYAKSPQYKDKIAIQIQKNENETEHTTNDIVYIYVDGLPAPMAFHTNLHDFPNIDGIPTVSKKVKEFYSRNSVNIIYPLSEEERASALKEKGQANSELQYKQKVNSIIRMVGGEKNKEGVTYKSITNPKNISGYSEYEKKRQIINQFVKEVIEVQGGKVKEEALKEDTEGKITENENIQKIITDILQKLEKNEERDQYYHLLKIAEIIIRRNSFRPGTVTRFKDSEDAEKLEGYLQELKEFEDINELKDKILRVSFSVGLEEAKSLILERDKNKGRKRKRISVQELLEGVYDADAELSVELEECVKTWGKYSSRYKKAFTEAYAILRCLSERDYDKIPVDVLKVIKNNKSVDYSYRIDRAMNLSQQQMLPETKAILFNILRDYLVTPEQKQRIQQVQMKQLKKVSGPYLSESVEEDQLDL